MPRSVKIRTKILPTAIADIAAFTFIAICIPVTAVHQLFFVLPVIYEVGSFFYIIAFASGLFLLFNIKINLIATMMTNTSIQGQILNPPENDQRKLWRFCGSCETLCPPRSWHCSACKTCILKRDHHCIFTGCCIGYHNHRYFLVFLLYFCIGTLYTVIQSVCYFFIARPDFFSNFLNLLTLICPLFFLPITGHLIDRDVMCILIFELNVMGFIFSLALLISQVQIINKGSVSWEFNKGQTNYNFGWDKNMDLIFGKRKHLVWLSPFIESELPMDGIHWEEIIEESVKNK